MKLNAVLVISVFFACASTAALAAPPQCTPPGQVDKGNKGNGKEKITLLHCGCAAEVTRMEFVQISVSHNSKGHIKHLAGSIDSCSAGGDSYVDFVRNGSDCQIDGPEVEGIAFCTDQVAGQVCGSEVID